MSGGEIRSDSTRMCSHGPTMQINRTKPHHTTPRQTNISNREFATEGSEDAFLGSMDAPLQQRPQFANPTAGNLRAAFEGMPTTPHVSDLRLLSDNAESWTARWELLESATENINAQYYAWDNDVFGMAMMGHIYHKASQGVETKVMVDAVGDTFGKRGFKSHRGGRDYLQELVALPNAQSRVYHPNHQKLLTALTHPLGGEGIAANHDKILEVDGRGVVAGGRNISHHYYMHPEDKADAWRDTDLMLAGEGTAQEFRDAFDLEFENDWITEKVGKDKLGNWSKKSGELLGAYLMMDSWLKAPAFTEAEKDALRGDEGARRELADRVAADAEKAVPGINPSARFNGKSKERLLELASELVEHLELRGSSRARRSEEFAGAEVKVIDTTSAVGKPLDEMNGAFVSLIDSAQERIDIQSPYFVLTDGATEALQRAGRRGVEISIATNTPSSTDSAHTQVFFLNDWKKALAKIPNLSVHGATGERKMHGKMAIFDDSLTVVSSYNMDLVSKEINGEVGAVVWGPEFAAEARTAMRQDFDDPTIGYREYQIARDDSGQALEGEQGLVSTFGPEDHVEPAALDKYTKKIKRWNWMRRHLPQLKEVRKFALD